MAEYEEEVPTTPPQVETYSDPVLSFHPSPLVFTTGPTGRAVLGVPKGRQMVWSKDLPLLLVWLSIG